MTRRRKPRPSDGTPGPVRHPPGRTLIAPGASAEEAAAIVAALERFISDTTPAPAPPAPTGPGRWLRAALLEGVRRGERRRASWGDPHP